MGAVSRWGISDAHGDDAARALIDAYVEDKTTTGANRPPPFDKPRESVHSDVVRIVTECFAHLDHTEGILVCRACAVPVVIQVHAREEARNYATEGPHLALREATLRAPTPARPGRAHVRSLIRTSFHMTLRRAFGIALNALSNTAPWPVD